MRLSKNDPSSYSTPETEIIEHVEIDWTVDFERKVLKGTAELQVRILAPKIEKILLDADDLKISEISVVTEAGSIPVTYEITDHVPEIGSKLTVFLPTETSGRVNLLFTYETSPASGGLQWLSPIQTSSKKHPFLFSQCQAIYARSLLPCQDSPTVKFTYKAKLRYPKELTGLLAAINVKREPGYAEYEQTVPIQSYLIAIAVGDLYGKDLSPISTVWAEKDVVDKAAWEFAHTNTFLEKAIAICGEYVWKRYDLLVLPPSFPFGGMENPCLTFVTPTIIAGDRSLANVVAHEISHSWTGNLVTNRNFEHFWLNEGFTVFTEGKILGAIDGAKYRDFHSIQNLSELQDCINVQLKDTPELQRLVVDLTNCTPDDAFSSIPYIKGSMFLRYLEHILGGPEVFEPFFLSYLEKYKYKSIVTDDFKKTLWEYFSDAKYEKILESVDWDQWLFGTGMPPIIIPLDDSILKEVLAHVEVWKNYSLEDIKKSELIKYPKLSSLQVVEMLSKLQAAQVVLDREKLALLVSTYKIEKTHNCEILFFYLRLCILARDLGKLPAIFEFINSNFRMKYIRKIYKELGQWPEARDKTIANFNQVKDQMMKMVCIQIVKDLGIK